MSKVKSVDVLKWITDNHYFLNIAGLNEFCGLPIRTLQTYMDTGSLPNERTHLPQIRAKLAPVLNPDGRIINEYIMRMIGQWKLLRQQADAVQVEWKFVCEQADKRCIPRILTAQSYSWSTVYNIRAEEILNSLSILNDVLMKTSPYMAEYLHSQVQEISPAIAALLRTHETEKVVTSTSKAA